MHRRTASAVTIPAAGPGDAGVAKLAECLARDAEQLVERIIEDPRSAVRRDSGRLASTAAAPRWLSAAGLQTLTAYLRTGEKIAPEHRAALGDIGRLQSVMSLSDMLGGYLLWREHVKAAVVAAAEEHSLGQPDVSFVLQSVDAHVDASLRRLAVSFDAERCRLLDSLNEERERLRHMVLHDALTGLGNRSRLWQDLRAAVEAGGPAGLLYADLDGFKAVNDRLGHEAGDEVVVEVARRMRSCLRESDRLCRVGGDEFVAVLTGPVTEADCRAAASRMAAALSSPVTTSRGQARVGVSVGGATVNETADADVQMARADQAMYRAKATGGGYRFAVAG